MANRHHFRPPHEENVIVRRESVRVTGITGAVLMLVLGAVGGACGGSKPMAKAPAPEPIVAVPAPVVTDRGQQGGITAGPGGGSELSGSAKDAYDRGFTAWVTGDLKTARDAFSDAASKAPNAAAPRYSL